MHKQSWISCFDTACRCYIPEEASGTHVAPVGHIEHAEGVTLRGGLSACDHLMFVAQWRNDDPSSMVTLIYCHWPHANKSVFRVVITCHDPGIQALTFLLFVLLCVAASFTSKQAAVHSATCRNRFYLRDAACPRESDDGDNWTWIFTATDVDMLACLLGTSSCMSPVLCTKTWPWSFYTTLTLLSSSSCPPSISYLN